MAGVQDGVGRDSDADRGKGGGWGGGREASAGALGDELSRDGASVLNTALAAPGGPGTGEQNGI